MTTYLKGKDLRHKGHTLECWLNSIEPSPIVYKTDKIEAINATWDGLMVSQPEKKPEGFDGW